MKIGHFSYFHMTYFTQVHSKTEYKLSNFLRSYVGTIGNQKLLTEISCTCVPLQKMKRLLQCCGLVAATLQQLDMYATTGGDKVANLSS